MAMAVMIICTVFLILCLQWLCLMLAARRRTDHMPIQEVDGQMGKPQVKTGLNTMLINNVHLLSYYVLSNPPQYIKLTYPFAGHLLMLRTN